jgi:hypothetical protein
MTELLTASEIAEARRLCTIFRGSGLGGVGDMARKVALLARALDAIEALQAQLDEAREEAESWRHSYEQYADVVKAQLEDERWRDVAQEPPVNDGYLTEPLLFIVDDVVEKGRRARYTDGQWHWWDEEGCECHGITHWRPWPKPPKEAQK